MDYKRLIVNNIFWLSFGQIASRLLGALFFFYLAAKIGGEGIGVYGFVFSFLGIFFIVNDFGLYQYFVRKWSQDDSAWREEFAIAFSFRTIAVIALAAAVGAYGWFLEKAVLAELSLAFLALALDQWRTLQEARFAASNRFRLISAAQTWQRFLEVVAGGAFLFFGYGLKAVLLIYVLTRLLSVIYFNIRGRFHYHFVFSVKDFWELGRRSFPFLFIGLFAAVYFKIDVVMIRYLIGYEAAGWYNAAYKFISLAAIAPGLAVAAIFPVIAKLVQEGDVSLLKNIINKMTRAMLILVAPITILGFIFADEVIGFAYRPEFQSAAPALKILTLAMPFVFISGILISLLGAEHREKIILKITALAAVFNIGLNFVLIPLLSIYGAALATVATEVGVLVAAWAAAGAKPNFGYWKELGGLAALAAGLAIILSGVNFILASVVIVIVYVGAAYGLEIITKREINFFWMFFKKKYAKNFSQHG